jgi:hypothetical protein
MKTKPDAMKATMERIEGHYVVFLSTYDTTHLERRHWASMPSIRPHGLRVIPYDTEADALAFMAYWSKTNA